jgi:hypothetical protein
MSFLLFDRKVEIRIGVPANPQATIFGIGRSWTDLKIEFDVKRSLGKDPNVAKVELFNPDSVSIGIIQSTGAMMQVLAGYGPFPTLLFTGNVSKRGVTVEKDGTERVAL